ncbi:site-specific tyrosine recombinase XerD [Microlunatus soli]|uniref:site-specific tyrosine recombinase XerD n=1 Tax=Microlunatus soli TaxID=630515 RepID=UPI0022B253D0|nr:site-specific tyrosine recombinase XerD [Microlunatus soli]
MINSYLDHLAVERGLSEHTVAGYRRDLARYAAYLDDQGITEPRDIESSTLTGYAVSLAEGVPDRYPALAQSSAARALAAVRGLHRFAAEEGVTEQNPAAQLKPPRPARRLPKALPLDAVQTLLAAPGTETPLALRDTALLELLYGTGGRISEVVGLDVDELSGLLSEPDEVGGLRVIGKGNKERFVPLGRYAKKAVTDYLVRGRPDLARRGRGTPGLLLNARGGRLSRQGAWLIMQQTAERADLKIDISPHTLRHSFATHLLDGGADVRVVQELLGHASVTTTQIYTLVTVDHLREVYLTAHPRAR